MSLMAEKKPYICPIRSPFTKPFYVGKYEED